MTVSLLDRRFFDKTFGVSNSVELEDDIDSHLRAFENLCKDKVLSMNLTPEQLIQTNQFITIIDRINKRYPFLFLPSFIQDLMSGYYSRTLLEKYHLRNFLELNYITENILKIKGNRIKGFKPETLKKNLENSSWKKIYDIIINNGSIFENELFVILNQHLLRAFIILALYTNKNGLTKEEITHNFSNIFETHQNRIQLFKEKEIFDMFKKYLNEEKLEITIEQILNNLTINKFLREDFSEKRYYLESKYAKIDEAIISILSNNRDGIHHDRFHRALLREVGILKFIPKVGLWENVLTNLEKSKVKRVTTFWRYSPYRDQLFLQEDFERKIREMREQIVAAGRTKFFGRRISPQNFVSELKELEKGDLDDTDDQVTRIAGLILASSAILQTPHENLEVFDFAVDVSNYSFSNQQIEAMKSVNFSISGDILHFKVMIEDTVDLSLINKIKEILPKGHQAVLFSFRNISVEVKSLLSSDKSIQIVGKDGILAWASITPIIPCRVGSVAKIRYGNTRGRIVRINSINHESGLASISDFYNNKEESVYIGSLEEICFGNFSVNGFNEALSNYKLFLGFLAKNTVDEIFNKAIFEPNIQRAEYFELDPDSKVRKYQEIDVKKNEKFIPPPDGNSRNITKIIEWKVKISDIETTIKYRKSNNYISLDLSQNESPAQQLKQFFKCECILFNEQTQSLKFCPHLISTIDFVAKKLGSFDNSWNDEKGNVMKTLLTNFQKLKNYGIIDYVGGWFFDEYFEKFIQYVKTIPCIDNDQNKLKLSDQSNISHKIKQELLNQFNSDELIVSFSELEHLISTLKRDDLLKIISALELRHEYSLRRRRVI